MAASATFALKAGLCVRRARRVIVTPDRRHSRRSQAGFPLIELSEFARPPLPHFFWCPLRSGFATALDQYASGLGCKGSDLRIRVLRALGASNLFRSCLHRSFAVRLHLGNRSLLARNLDLIPNHCKCSPDNFIALGF